MKTLLCIMCGYIKSWTWIGVQHHLVCISSAAKHSLCFIMDHLDSYSCSVVQESKIEAWTRRTSLSELSTAGINREAVGTDIGDIITNHRRRPFFTEGLYTGNPLKSLRLLLDVCWGWMRESTGKPCPLIKEGGSHRRSHYTADSRPSHLPKITKWGI